MHMPFQKPASSTPKDVFQHLLMIVTLYIGVVSLITLLIQYIDVLFPDPLNFYYQGILDGIRMSSSTLIVVTPVFLLMSWLVQKEITHEPEKHELKIRKWLMYLTLFIASITIIIDLIQLVYNFYSGELTTKFALKVLAVLFVTGAVFVYYLWDLRGLWLKTKAPKVFAWGTVSMVLVSIVAGFFIVGSPAQQRLIRFDDQRVSDLQNLQGQIINHWTQKQKLPATLDELKDSISGFVPPLDPVTHQSYQYQVATPLSFKLCASFALPSLDKKFGKPTGSATNYPTPVAIQNGYFGGFDMNWSHDAGEKCFDRTIDPQLYKPIYKQVNP
jgi:hypothetical protein